MAFLEGAGDKDALRSGASAMTEPVAITGAPPTLALSVAGEDPLLEQAVRLVLSEIVGEAGGGRGSVRHVATMLAAIGGNEEATMPAADKSLREAGVSPTELDRRWRTVRRGARLLPDEILTAFFPRASRRGMANALRQGPAETWTQFDRILDAWTIGMKTDGTPRVTGQGRRTTRTAPDGTPELSKGYVKNLLVAARRVHRAVAEVQREAERLGLCGVLTGWNQDSLPSYRLDAYDAKPADTDRTAPPLRAVRLALQAADAEARRRSSTTAGRPTAYKYIRNRVIVALVAVLGLRLTSLYLSNVEDYVTRHRFPDGTVGPALRIQLGEGAKGGGRYRYKGLPQVVAEWIDILLAEAGTTNEPSSPLWLSINEPERARRDRLTKDALGEVIIDTIKPFVDDRSYSPHTLRHLTEQLAELVGSEWISEHRDQLIVDLATKGVPLSALSFAQMLIDHELTSVADIYRDLANEQARENWSRTAALGVWEFLWGARGARKGPDSRLIREMESRQRQAEETLASAEGRLSDLKDRRREQIARAIADAETLTPQALLKRMLEIESIGDTIMDAVDAVHRAASAQSDAAIALTEAKAVRIPVPDDVADSEIWNEDDEDEPEIERPPLPERDWVSVREYLWCFGEDVMPPATVYRWLNGKLRYQNGDRRNLLELDADGRVLGLEEISPRHRRLKTALLPLARYPAEFRERLDYLLTFPSETAHGKRRR